MKTKRNLIQIYLLGVLLLALPAVAQAQTYTNSNGIIYTNSNGTSGAVVIPSTINGLTVSAKDWRAVLKPLVARYQGRNIPRYFRADAAFANPELYEYLESV